MSVLAEQAVIGIMLISPQDAPKAISTLSRAMFEHEALGCLFQRIKTLVARGIEPDAVTVAGGLGDEYKELAVRCAETVPSISNFENYITQVMDDWRQRDMLSKMQEMVFDRPTADEMTATLNEMLEKQNYIIAHQRKTSQRTFAEGLNPFMEWLKKPNTNIKTGFEDFDRRTGGFVRKGVIAVAARPGGGKSTLGLQMACNISSNYLTLYQSLEMPSEQVYANIFSRALQIDSRRITNKVLNEDETARLIEMSKLLSDRYHLIIDDSPMTTLDDLERTIQQRKPEVVFIDHLGLVTPDRAKQKRNEELAAMTRRVKALAMKYDVVIVEQVQANRDADNRKIGMADMFGSATIEQDADMILAINKGEETDSGTMTTVDCIKNRHGPTGECEFIWRKEFHEFREVY